MNLVSADREVALAPLKPRHRKALVSLANNKKISDNLRDHFPSPYTEDDGELFIQSLADEQPVMTFAIEYRNEFCGVIGLVKQPDVYRVTAEIGYWVGEPFWNKGIATKAVDLITGYGLNTLKFTRIHTGIFEYNKASMKVLEKCGYKKDCVFEKSVVKNGRIWNEHRYSIVG